MTVRTTCVTGWDANALASVPDDDQFIEGDDYIEAPEIQEIAECLFQEYPDRYADALELPLIYLWRRKAKKHQGKNVLGYAGKTSGVLKHISESDFVLEFAADLARQLTNLQLEALVFHELLHVGAEVDKKGVSKAAVVGHDTEMFRAEIEVYGLWRADLKLTAAAFHQIPLGAGLPDLTVNQVVADADRESAANLHRTLQKIADKDGVSMTMGNGDQSFTIGPRKQRSVRAAPK